MKIYSTIKSMGLWKELTRERAYAARARKPVKAVSTGGVASFAAIWDYLEEDNDREALLIEVTGELDAMAARTLAAGLTRRYPNATVAVIGKSTALTKTYPKSPSLPASPTRPWEGVLQLNPERTEAEARVGYDIVVWCGEAKAPDVRVQLFLDRWEMTAGAKSASGTLSAAFTHTDLGNEDRVDFWKNPKPKKYPRELQALTELNAIIDSLGLPERYGKGSIPFARSFMPVREFTPEEKYISAHLYVANGDTSMYGSFEGPGVLEEISGLLREKLTPEQIEIIYALIKGDPERSDFFNVVQIARNV